ncbi:hypothetical protein Taro_002684 [Colocasia esculenta]|uniref:Uncharacterized protein n=1 Tax=Colocasia esculenta TaxID=4460 RepID=A0A843TDD3_COLES|nr:hypothetical protein [Colocasia esculenta]
MLSLPATLSQNLASGGAALGDPRKGRCPLDPRDLTAQVEPRPNPLWRFASEFGLHILTISTLNRARPAGSLVAPSRLVATWSRDGYPCKSNDDLTHNNVIGLE